jgi:hypothetical protein
LAGAFGGGGGGAFGAKTGDVFTWITVAFAGVFLLLTVLGNFVFEPTGVVIATPPVAQPVPGPPGSGPQSLQFPLEEGVDPEGIKVEKIGQDGAVVPLDVTITEEPAGSPPPAAPAGESPASSAGSSGDASKTAEPPAPAPAAPPSDAPQKTDPQDPGR